MLSLDGSKSFSEKVSYSRGVAQRHSYENPGRDHSISRLVEEAKNDDRYYVLYRGVNNENFGYDIQKKGLVMPNYIKKWWEFWKQSEATPREHNTKSTLFSPFTSWTTDYDVAKHYALNPAITGRRNIEKAYGKVLIIIVRKSEIHISPNEKSINLIHRPGDVRSESEVLLRGVRNAFIIQDVNLLSE